MPNFAKKLADLMEKRGLSQSGLSRISGIAQKTISNYLREINRPSWEHVQRLADAIGVVCTDLRDDETPKAKKKGSQKK